MIISNVRLGHATNSSSSHSIVINSKKKEDECVNDFQYGWETFHLKKTDSKMKYLAAQIYENLRNIIGKDTALLIINQLFGYNLQPDDDIYVDHQSEIAIPYTKKQYGKYEPDYEFIKALQEHFKRPELSIFGGNDNGDADIVDGVPDPITSSLTKDYYSGVLLSKKCGEWWILYNKHNGTIVKLSFNDKAAPLTHSDSPLLVDMKITNRCYKGCPFCYQGSNAIGLHADISTISSIIVDLARQGVWEIAFGGGEPTEHPQFETILELCNQHDIRPNFSTGSTKWLKNPSILSTVNKLKCAIGASPDVFEVIKAVVDCPVYCHAIAGVDDIISILKSKEYATMVILGFKSVGRGISIKPKTYSVDKIIKTAAKQGWSLAVDTKFADMHHKELLGAKISPILMTQQEGAFSMYINAVSETIAKDSYSGNDIKIGQSAELCIKEHFPFVK